MGTVSEVSDHDRGDQVAETGDGLELPLVQSYWLVVLAWGTLIFCAVMAGLTVRGFIIDDDQRGWLIFLSVTIVALTVLVGPPAYRTATRPPGSVTLRHGTLTIDNPAMFSERVTIERKQIEEVVRVRIDRRGFIPKSLRNERAGLLSMSPRTPAVLVRFVRPARFEAAFRFNRFATHPPWLRPIHRGAPIASMGLNLHEDDVDQLITWSHWAS
jgi:hypothetical protein